MHGRRYASSPPRKARACEEAPRPAIETAGSVARNLGDRRRRDSGEPGLARAVQPCSRPLQGRPPVSPDRDGERAQVPRLRADPQEQPHGSADGGSQGRLELQSEGQERARGDLSTAHFASARGCSRLQAAVPGRHRTPAGTFTFMHAATTSGPVPAGLSGVMHRYRQAGGRLGRARSGIWSREVDGG